MTITLKLKDRIVEFTPEEALAVYRELNEMFGCNSENTKRTNEWLEDIKKNVPIAYPPYYYPVTPSITNPMPFGPWIPCEIIC